jgi:hypothetical protein
MNNLTILIIMIIIVILLINSQNNQKEGFNSGNDVKQIGLTKFLNTLKKIARAEKEYIDGYKYFRNNNSFWEYAVKNYRSNDFGKIAEILRSVQKNGIEGLSLNIETDDNKKYSAKYFDDLKNKYLNTDISNIPLITEIDKMIENLYERNEPWLRVYYTVPIFRLRNIDITSSKWIYSIIEDDETNDNLLEWDFNQNPFTSSNQIASQFLFFAEYWLKETNKNIGSTNVLTKGDPYTYLGKYMFSKSNDNYIGQLNIHMSNVKYAWTWSVGSTDIKAINPNPTLTSQNPMISNTTYYGPHSKIWNDADCNPLKSSSVSNLEDCKIECDNTQECTAFNYYKDKCFLRKCENNKKPSWDNPPYKGYSKYDIVKDVQIPTTTTSPTIKSSISAPIQIPDIEKLNRMFKNLPII